ncbi:hypothetical protein HHI36_002113 [Cryptolaemus montrouzieri]|uniref:Uncharacterized protein n=1 Tax=Cryptolaemus montrouzieri TaxID=559131 RepID=A0ABD2PAX0_9CUCU
MKKLPVFCVCFISSVYGQMVDLSNLGPAIEKSVRDALAPLNNLGYNNQKMFHQFEDQMRKTEKQMGYFQNIGEKIKHDVEKQIEPLRAFEMKNKMMNGEGGHTIVKYPDGTNIVVENGIRYICKISSTGTCLRSRWILDATKDKNYCYSRPQVVSNDFMCFTSGNAGISMFTAGSGSVRCTSSDGTQTFITSKSNYENMCKQVGQPTYYYTADVNDHDSVKIPNNNPYLKCQNNEPNKCVFME